MNTIPKPAPWPSPVDELLTTAQINTDTGLSRPATIEAMIGLQIKIQQARVDALLRTPPPAAHQA